MPTAYAPHDRLIATARARPQLWRLAAGTVLGTAVYVALMAGLFLYIRLAHGDFVAGAVILAMSVGATPGMLVLLLFSFAGLAIGAFVAVRALHGRSAATLFGAPPGRILRDALRVAGPVILLQVALLPLSLGEGAARHVPLATVLAWLPLAAVGLAVQTGAEEVAFRGYLQSQTAARFGRPLAWIAGPSVLFAAGHFSPATYGPAAVPVVLWAFVFGCLAADLTARTGNLGAAIGFHFATNFGSMILLGLAGNLDGLALWTVAPDFTDAGTVARFLAADFLMMAAGWLLARLVLRV
ncbi:MAG: CPBP family intramembrane metalloprotease [Rhodobacteraceae bacterium]|nr:CPBP family intramembrane metalloprotease [Paracoccaceae bacterium]